MRQRDPNDLTPLPVSAPFHCALMKPAEERLAPELRALPASDPRVPVVANVRPSGSTYLMEGDVTVDVSHSSVNFKDGLAITGKAPIARFEALLGYRLDRAKGMFVLCPARNRKRTGSFYTHADQHAITFHPDYAENGRLFLHYTSATGTQRINNPPAVSYIYAPGSGPHASSVVSRITSAE